MDLMSNPDAASARMADSRPAPGPLTFTSTERTPCSCASWAAFCAATCAANGVPLREPLKPMRPALDQERTLPIGSVMDTMVLLNVAAIEATPCGTLFFSFFFVPARRAPAFGARAVAILSSLALGRSPLAVGRDLIGQRATINGQLFLGSFLLAGDRALARAFARAGVGVRPLAAHRKAAAMAHPAVAVDLHQALDVEADVLAEVALDLPLVGDDLADLAHVILGEVLDARVAVHPGRDEDVVGPRTADAEDVSQTDFHSLVEGQIHASNTCHCFSPGLRTEC